MNGRMCQAMLGPGRAVHGPTCHANMVPGRAVPCLGHGPQTPILAQPVILGRVGPGRAMGGPLEGGWAQVVRRQRGRGLAEVDGWKEGKGEIRKKNF